MVPRFSICNLTKPLKYNRNCKLPKLIVFSVVVLPQVTLCRMHESWMGSFSLSLSFSVLWQRRCCSSQHYATSTTYYVEELLFRSLYRTPRFTQSTSLSLVFARNSHSLNVHNHCSWLVCSIDRLAGSATC